MRVLEFNVTGQQITKNPDCDFSGIVAGTRGYLYAKFRFSKEWKGCTKAASFFAQKKEYPVLLDAKGVCEIPYEALTGPFFLVGVTGKQEDKILTTDTCDVYQDRRSFR